MKNIASRSRMRGLSLVEVMVSVVIGLVVVGAVLVSYLSSGKTTRQQAAYAEMHENAQMALTILSRDLLLAGYAQVTGTIAPVSPATLTRFTRTYQFSNTQPAVFGCDNGFVTPGALAVTCKTTADKPGIEVTYEADIKNTVPAGSPAGPSDCKGTKITPATGTFGTPAVEYFITHNRFYLKPAPNGLPGFELYCSSAMGGSAEPLVDNVDDMKIWYGEAKSPVSTDDIGKPDFRRVVRYVTAGNLSTPGDFSRVVAVKVCLLMRSTEQVLDTELTATPTYLNCDSVSQNLPDRYLRRAYFTTVTLRNKMAF